MANQFRDNNFSLRHSKYGHRYLECRNFLANSLFTNLWILTYTCQCNITYKCQKENRVLGFLFYVIKHLPIDEFQIASNGRAVFVTGCDTGFGHELSKKLHAMGFTVFATCFDEKSNGATRLKRLGDESGRLHVIQMDVTKQEDVDNALEYVEKHLPENGLWGLVNNAGQSSTPGFLEWTPMSVYEKVYLYSQSQTNIWLDLH